jgi:hypothetical protein
MTTARAWPVLTVAILTAGLAAGGDTPRTVTFTKDDLGKVPAGWTSARTGKGDGSVWKVTEDATGPGKSGVVLTQTAESPAAVFNLCVLDGVTAADVTVTVAFKANAGVKDQGGGVVWRYQDANNYYVARFNPLEDNFRLYHVVSGKRTQIGGKEELRLKAGEWHTLGVSMAGDRITCTLDGRVEVEATDKTIEKAGRVGLWTKADARTSFDRFEVRPVVK